VTDPLAHADSGAPDVDVGSDPFGHIVTLVIREDERIEVQGIVSNQSGDE
jgi:hypothetical protein